MPEFLARQARIRGTRHVRDVWGAMYQLPIVNPNDPAHSPRRLAFFSRGDFLLPGPPHERHLFGHLAAREFDVPAKRLAGESVTLTFVSRKNPDDLIDLTIDAGDIRILPQSPRLTARLLVISANAVDRVLKVPRGGVSPPELVLTDQTWLKTAGKQQDCYSLSRGTSVGPAPVPVSP